MSGDGQALPAGERGRAGPAAPAASGEGAKDGLPALGEIGRAVADVENFAGFLVLSYVGSDGFPRLAVADSVQDSGRGQISVVLSGPDQSLRHGIGTLPRVGLLCRDQRSGVTYRFAGRARLAEGPSDRHPVPAGSASGESPSGHTLVIDVERLETAGRGLPQQRSGRAPEPAAGRGVLLDVAGLSIYYGATRAVHDLALSVARGEIFGLLGPNGAGKTSTLSAIEGLLRPRSGTVVLDGTDVLRHPIEARAKMGVQLQATSFQSSLTIKQIMRLYAGLYGVRMTERELSATITAIGLDAEAGKPFKQLSGGQQQRLALQIAVLHRPTLLLLDEPTAGLDPQARRQLWSRIEGLRRDGGSILLTTHSMEEAQAVCDRVAIMDHGQIITCGSPAELISRHRDDPAVRAVAHGGVTLDDVFVGLTGSEIRD